MPGGAVILRREIAPYDLDMHSIGDGEPAAAKGSWELRIHGGALRGPTALFLSSAAMPRALISFSSLSQHVKIHFSFLWISLPLT